MTGSILLATVFAVAGIAVIAGLIGLVTLAIHTEERRHTLTRRAPGWIARAARRLNGVFILAPDTAEEPGSRVAARTAPARARRDAGVGPWQG